MTTPSEALPANNGAGTAETGAAAAAVGTSSPAAASPGGDLSSLLKEYETKTSTVAPADLSKVLKAFEPVARYVEEEAQTKAQSRLQSDVDEAVKLALGDIPVEKSRLARGYLRDLVETDPKALEAWNDRLKNPDAWKTVCTQANVYLKETLGQTAPNTVRTDIDRAAASVRNLSTDPPKLERPSPMEALTMSDRDWGVYKAKVEAANQTG